MKQIVDFKQAKGLWEAGARIIYVGACIDSRGIYISRNCLKKTAIPKYFLPAPTLGELIEWIMQQKNLVNPFNQILELQIMMETNNRYDDKEQLVDALVELCLKIQEDKKQTTKGGHYETQQNQTTLLPGVESKTEGALKNEKI